MNDTVKFLKDCEVSFGTMCHCGDGCCSHLNWNARQVYKNEEFPAYLTDFTGLIEGIDFVYIK